jgi:hypothetical protein
VIRELSPPVAPQRIADHQLLTGIEGAFPPLAGFVQTTVKENSLVEVLLRSPVPAMEKNATVLATWTYGLGKAAALTTDAGSLWASSWKDWDNYEKFFSQFVRWSMRPAGEQGNFTIATQTTDGRTQVVIDALDDQDDFVNQLSLYGNVVGPELKPLPLTVEQTAPGRYVGEFAASDPGSYFVTISTPNGSMLRAGVSVGASREYGEFQINLPLLERLAGNTPKGGAPGQVIAAGGQLPFATEAGSKLAQDLDPFRRDLPPAETSRDMWPPLVVAACVVFLSDIFIRRVQLDFTGLGTRFSRLFARRQLVEAPATLARLSAKKAEIRDRYQPPTAEAPPVAIVAAAQKPTVAKPPAVKEVEIQEPSAEETMTSRLLAAKKAVKDNRWRRDDS